MFDKSVDKTFSCCCFCSRRPTEGNDAELYECDESIDFEEGRRRRLEKSLTELSLISIALDESSESIDSECLDGLAIWTVDICKRVIDAHSHKGCALKPGIPVKKTSSIQEEDIRIRLEKIHAHPFDMLYRGDFP